MAVPKKKTSPSRRNMRRSHDRLKAEATAIDATTGNIIRPHHMDLETGYYNGKLVKPPKKSSINEDSEK